MASEKPASKRAYTRLEFTLEQEEQLIEYVRDNPVLYNIKDPQYKNKSFRDRLWEEFGTTISKSGLNGNGKHCSFLVFQDWIAERNGSISETHL